jgi:hypothetical protein
MHFVSFFDTNSTIMFWWWLDWLIVVILRIYVYLYAFCIIFRHEFNYNICVAIRLICFGNLHICICILYHFLARIQLWCLCGDWTDLFWEFWEFTDMYMHSVSFFSTNSTVTWGEWAIAMHGRYESHILFISFTYISFMYTPWYVCIFLPYTLF